MKDDTNKRRRTINTVCVVLVVAIMIYLFQDIFHSNFKMYDTVTADEIVEQETIPLKAFIVRDEEYIDGQSSGTVVPLVSDGKRVASGDSVAIVCRSEEDAADYMALQETIAERERFLALSSRTDDGTVDIEKLNAEIENQYAGLMKATGSSDYRDVNGFISELEDKLAEKQLLTDENVDFSDKLAETDKKIAGLEAKGIHPQNVEAPLSGYYISHLDGYEKTADYENVGKLTVSQIDNLLKAEPKTVSGKMGKIVGSYKWYIVSTVDSKYVKVLTAGKSMRVNLPFYGIEGITVTVESVSGESDGRIAIVLSCTLMNDTYANMRTVDAELIMDEYRGYKVPSTAVRSVTAENGKKINVVYILRGDIMTARVVDVLYTPKDSDYTVVSASTKSIVDEKTKKVLYSAIKRYDEVIVKGRNLENGKSIG